MAHLNATDTDDSAVPAALRRFLHNRLLEVSGLAVLAATATVSVALATWSVGDPSRNHAIDIEPLNALGLWGAYVSDELVQALGLSVVVLLAVPIIWGFGLLAHRAPAQPLRQGVMWFAAAWLAGACLAMVPAPSSWVLGSGLGGSIGDVLTTTAVDVLSLGLKTGFAKVFVFLVAFGAFASTFCRAIGCVLGDLITSSPLIGERGQDVAARLRGGFGHMGFRLKTIARNLGAGFTSSGPGARDADPAQAKSKPQRATLLRDMKAWYTTRRTRADIHQPAATPVHDRVEPVLSSQTPARPEASNAHDASDDAFYDPSSQDAAPGPGVAVPVTRTAKPIRQSTRAKRDAQPSFTFTPGSKFELPPVTLLSEARQSGRPADLCDEALEQNARMLEGVLEDFGVRGDIINVRPGPVVTLYELEPAPGIKSSRVIGLADDIARSMSAISARVAVVPGRNVIGIELPNSSRETVYLREMLGSQAYEKTKQHLALALGKNIGGEPVFADLARMPHLLIAGTTGSGKSVGINTMILSLLYKNSPDKCKLIMIDPKMLELSVYEGIPHLLAPVVTDPRKAVVALKWAVREMEDRYRKMSKVGVRNIDGFNSRIKQAVKKGEAFTRTVQTGYDPETGEPIFEQEEMDLQPMPYIVVIIDEMADLMMVAGKDIEGAVQRLAQMARAAGIHVIMATQRPSVDVITGTIKANFPTRISFQVTSKIDSRTILGEQGAEQLLGQGDMLFMAGGGRISRLHGPFVADGEVEEIVNFLKAQGAPDYVEAVTEEDELEANGPQPFDGGPSANSGDDLYDQAVAVVLRDKKVSTSYIQRRLQIGYNKAASLIERMEEEGLISAPNNSGKREILVGDPSVE